MHKRIYGVFDLGLTLSPQADLLVQAGQDQETSSDGRGEATQFFRARDPQNGEQRPCIPGTTFKGVLRSTAEKILRSFDDRLACDPFDEAPSHPQCACSHRLDAKRDDGQSWRPDEVYGLLCPACRLFGSLAHAGLIEVEDAWATRVARSRKQARIAVDRLLGGAAPGMMYHIQPLTSESKFKTALKVRNFELWQLGLLGLTLRELNEGQALIGWGTRRGLGRVSVRFQEMQARYPRGLYEAAAQERDGPGRVPSAQRLMPAKRRAGLGYPVEDLWLLEGAARQTGPDWRNEGWVAFGLQDAGQIEAFLEDCVEMALAPRLRRGPDAFGYHRTGGE